MRAPVVGVGDGALGFWGGGEGRLAGDPRAALLGASPGKVLDKLPKGLQPKAKRALHEIMQAESREQAEELIEGFADE